ncbi:MAG: CPBP family intramembrane metalloprotease [Bacteroidetes bacterium]|nr:MAG: CPBP family intramembrane metalloprotease [Bacteroidota bacterium]
MNFLRAILFLFLYLIFGEIIGLWVYIPGHFGVKVYSFHFFVTGFLFLCLIILFLRYVKGRDYRFPQKTELKWYLLALLLGVLYIPFQNLLNLPYDFLLNDNNKIVFDFDGISDLMKLNSFATIILFPIAEELFFRDFLLEGLKRKYSIIFSLFFSSLLFSIMHFPYAEIIFDLQYSFNQLYITFFGGLILGLVYLKSKSVGPPIVMHIFWNLFAVMV